MPEQVIEAGSVRCVDRAGHTIAKPRIEGEHYCEKDAQIESLRTAIKSLQEKLAARIFQSEGLKSALFLRDKRIEELERSNA